MYWRDSWAEVLGNPTTELTFVGAQPPRASWFAAWSLDRTVSGSDNELLLWRPADGSATCAPTPVRRLTLAEVLELGRADAAGDLPSAASPSVRFAARLGHTALVVAAHGSINPAATALGADGWEAAGAPPELAEYLTALTAACPPALRARPILQAEANIPSARSVVSSALNALVDRIPRTPAAPLLANHEAFGSLTSTTIDPRRAAQAAAHRFPERAPVFVLRIRPRGDAIIAVLTLQDRDRPDEVLLARDLWLAPDDLTSPLASVRAQLQATIGRLSRLWPRLAELTTAPPLGELELDDVELDALLGPLGTSLGAGGLAVAPVPELLGRIELTPWIDIGTRRDPDPTPQYDDFGSGPRRRPRLDLSSLVEGGWRGTVDGRPLSDDELDAIVAAQRSIVRIRDQWVRLDQGTLDQLAQRRPLSAGEALALALDPVDTRIAVTPRLQNLADELRQLGTGPGVAIPAGLVADLRPYQVRGLTWLAELSALGLGGILADDMGLGKTVQVIALHCHLTEEAIRQTGAPGGPMLVVCPASVIGNWEREWNRFAPGVAVHRHHGADRDLRSVGPGEVVLATYGVARRDAASLGRVAWRLMVADEAQAIKNPSSRTARALRSIHSDVRFALTGTPIQNELLDLWALLDWAAPGLLGPQERFRREIVAPVEDDGDAEATERLNRLVQPFILRRRKTEPEIAPDLPPKTETDEIVPLTTEQAGLYRAVVTEVMSQIEGTTGIGRQGLVLRLLTRLKQACNHPVHLLGTDEENRGLGGRSGKLDRATELLNGVKANGEAALVFTQYVRMGELLVEHLENEGFSVRFLHGGLGVDARDRIVAEFQEGSIDVFVISLRAGGIGLNLTAATQVIHFDRWWNPAVEDQASDRAWRIGQDRPVHVHRLISEDTIEDRIAVLLEDKRRLADAIVGSGERWISELDDEALAELVALGSTTSEAVALGSTTSERVGETL